MLRLFTNNLFYNNNCIMRFIYLPQKGSMIYIIKACIMSNVNLGEIANITLCHHCRKRHGIIWFFFVMWNVWQIMHILFIMQIVVIDLVIPTQQEIAKKKSKSFNNGQSVNVDFKNRWKCQQKDEFDQFLKRKYIFTDLQL